MRADDRAHVVVSPIATPLPLAFVGLLLATLLLSGLELGWIPKAELHQCGWALIAVPIPLQLVAAFFGFRARSASAATGSSTLAAAWLAISLDLINAPVGSFTPSHSVGMLSFGVAAALLIPALADARIGSLLPGLALAVAAVRFLLTGIAAMTESTGVKHASGIVGLVVAAVALYAALALELEGATKNETLPTFRLPRAKRSFTAPLDEQVQKLEQEAGVRASL